MTKQSGSKFVKFSGLSVRVFRIILCAGLLLAIAVPLAAQPPVYPLKVSANNRYLVDQNDTPFMIVGDSPQAMIALLSTAEADAYFANRASYGFNAVQIHLLDGEAFGGGVDYQTYDGITAFTTQGDISTPRESYFARVDAILNLAAQHGIVVFLTAAETIDSLDLFKANGVTNSRAFGQYVGNRYKNFDNIVWDYGNDFQTWRNDADNAVILAVANGIKDTDSRHTHTVWLDFTLSASRDSPDWEALVNLDFVYTYMPTYGKVLREYFLSPPMPVYLGESNYEEEELSGWLTTPEAIRRQEYWVMTSGATGSFYGNYWTWAFLTGWQDHYNSPGAAQMPYFKNLFGSRAWWKLVPDFPHQVLTDGYGTFDEESFGVINSNDYATAALASDSSFMVAYLPSIRTVTLDMSKLAGAVIARWYDPSNGVYTDIAGSPFSNTGTQQFTPPGNNSDDNGDWVLVLDAMDTTPPQITDLLAAYGFNEGSGTVLNDLTGNGNGGTIANGSWTTSGKYGGALTFNGNGAIVTIPDKAALRLSTGMTLEAWVNPNIVTSAWRDVIYKGNDNYYLNATSSSNGVPAAGQIISPSTYSEVYGPSVLALNTWAHLAATYDGATLRLYINGVQVGSRAQTGAMLSSTNPLEIGGDSIYGQYFSGVIDEVRIYNAALTQSEIQTDMNTPLGSVNLTPDLTVTKTHTGAFSAGQIGAQYTLTVRNAGQGPTTGQVTLRDTLPAALTATGISGTGWTCTLSTVSCTRSDSLAGSSNYPSVTLAVNVSGSAPSSVTNAATVSGGGETNTTNDTVSDVTSIAPDTTLPSAPGALAASAISGTQINLSWGAATDNVGVTGYRVERCQGAGCSNFAGIGAVVTGTAFSDTALTPSASYSYVVRAQDAAGNLGPYTNVASATTVATNSHLLAAYGFNEGSGTVLNDLTGNGNGGTIANGSWTTSGKYGGALRFNGNGAIVTIPDKAALRLSTGMTLEAWVNPNIVTSAWRDVIYKGNDNYYLNATSSSNGVPAAGQIISPSTYSEVYGPSVLALNTWAHLAATYDGATLRLYINGVQVGSRAQTGAMLSSTNPLEIGGDSIYGQYFSGVIDEVRIYNAALTQSEIQTDMNTPLGTSITPDTTLPSPPGALAASAISGTQINLSWGAATDNVGVTGYRVERCQGAGCSNFAGIGAVVTGTTFSDTALTPSAGYSYIVRAQDAAGNLGPYTNVASATTVATNSHLLAAYGFNEGSGTVLNDLTGNGNGGTIANGSWTTSGKYGGALRFNGNGAIVTIPDKAALRLSTGMTLEAWVNPNLVTSARRDVIYKGNDNYYLNATSSSNGIPAAGQIISPSTYSEVYGPSVLALNTWAHLAATYDGATLRLYINGVQVGSRAQTGAMLRSTNPLEIGGDSIYGQYFSGVIDEVRIYNAALTQSEIQTDMNTPLGSINFTTDLAVTKTYTGAFSAGQIGAQYTTAVTDAGQGPTTGQGFTIVPRVSVLTPILLQQFSASGASPRSVLWAVDGVPGGSAAAGTISGDGLYSPPSETGTHTVTVTSESESSSATVYVTLYPGMFTLHNDNFRTGQNLSETVLSPANVNPATFGKLLSYDLDGLSIASPLYVAGVTIPDVGVRNVVYVATEHDSVYAFDADGLSAAPLWKRSFLGPGITTAPSEDSGECCDIAPEIGITGTPVIDRATGTLYVVAKTKEGFDYYQRLHALDITTGAEKLNGPVTLKASAAGSGNGSSGGQVPFDPLHEHQRPALLLSSGVIYIGFGSHGGVQPYHGWILGYDAATLQQTIVLNVSPNADGGGIRANGGLAADSAGNVYFITGNGAFTANETNGKDYGDSFVKFSSLGTVLDYFTPYNQSAIHANDSDLGAAGPLLLPDQPGLHPHLMVSAGRNNTIYLVDRDNMGHTSRGNNDNQIVQSLVNIFPNGVPEPGNNSAAVYYNGRVYFGPNADNIQAFQLTDGRLSTSAVARSVDIFRYAGATMAVSANGSNNGVLWAIQRNGDCGVDLTCSSASPGTLRAFDTNSPGAVLTEIYNSNQTGSRDAMGYATKFSVPLVANGKVFVASMSKLAIYSLLP